MNKKIKIAILSGLVILGGYILLYRGAWLPRQQGPAGTEVQPQIRQLAEVPESLPKDLLPEPMVPNLMQSRILPDGQEELRLEYVSLNSVATVTQVYRQALAAKGWGVELVSTDSRRARLIAKKAGQAAEFLLTATETSGTQVLLIYILEN